MKPQRHWERTVVSGESLIVAAYLDGYSTRYGLPSSYGTNRSYGYFPPPTEGHDTLLYIGRDPGDLRQRFDTAQTVDDVGGGMHAYLLTGQQQSWHELWATMRTLTVS